MRASVAPVYVLLVALYSALLVSAKNITVIVGGNSTSNDTSLIFQPQEVTADVGDFVIFNFTNGTHSVIQSTFAEPCIPIHETNKTINGFSSGLRDTVNGTAKTTLAIEVKAAGGENDTIWFFDMWGCGEGGVGAINANDSDWENFDAFVRNAKRLNGTGGDSNSGGGTFTGRPTSSRPVPTTTAGSSAERVGTNTVVAIAVLAPLLLTMFAL